MAEKLNKDAVYRAAKPKDKDYTINDGGGLVLLVKSSSAKSLSKYNCNNFQVDGRMV